MGKYPQTNGFPHVMIRWVAGVYGKRTIRFVTKGETEVSEEGVIFAHPDPFAGGKLKQECVEALVEITKQMSSDSRFKMCLVLSEKSAIFIEPDGSTWVANEPPSGGLRFDKVKSKRSDSH